MSPFENANTLLNCFMRYPYLARPLGDALRSAIQREQYIIPLVIGLIFLCGPTAIIGAIIAIVIFALYRMIIGWARTHISQKHGELIPPGVNFDSTAAIVCIRAIARIVATVPHVEPNLMFRAFVKTVLNAPTHVLISLKKVTPVLTIHDVRLQQA